MNKIQILLISMWSLSAFSAGWTIHFDNTTIATMAILELKEAEDLPTKSVFIIGKYHEEYEFRYFVRLDCREESGLKDLHKRHELILPTCSNFIKIKTQEELRKILKVFDELAPIDEIRQSIVSFFENQIEYKIPVEAPEQPSRVAFVREVTGSNVPFFKNIQEKYGIPNNPLEKRIVYQKALDEFQTNQLMTKIIELFDALTCRNKTQQFIENNINKRSIFAVNELLFFVTNQEDLDLVVGAIDVMKDEIYSFKNGTLMDNTEWKKFIVNNAELTNDYHANQQLYGLIIAVTTKLASSFIEKGKDYRLIYQFSAFGRFVAVFSGTRCDKGCLDFGRTRYGDMLTPLTDAYSCINPRIQELILNGIPDPIYCPESSPVKLMIDGDIILFSTMIFGEEMVLQTTKMNEAVYHFGMGNLIKIGYGLNHLKTLFDEALICPSEELMSRLGEFFWWFCIIKPVKRGDPSIAEIIVKAVMLSREVPIHPWQNGIIPWAETVLQPNPKKFGSTFHTMFNVLDHT